MRDLFLAFLFPIFLYYGFRTPVVALYLWFWTSMYPLQNWLYGFALSLRFNLVFSIVTMLGYVFMKNKPRFKITGLFVLVIVFALHSGLGVMMYAYFDAMWQSFEEFIKAVVFFIFVVLLLRKKEHFEGILMFLTIALCFYGVLEGLKVIVTAGGHNIYGLKGPLGDNNKVALGLNMAIPLVLYLAGQVHYRYGKLALYCIAFLCAIAVIGTASRGGFIGLIAMAAYYWWKNGKKLSIVFGVMFIAGVAVYLMPSEWFERMNTIKETSSATESPLTSRVTSWKINYLAALDHPYIGHGFNATAGQFVWQNYVHDLDSLNWGIETPIPKIGYVAHSIYFEVLGNQGFVGLFMFLLIIFLTISKINKLCKQAYQQGSWEHQLLTSIKVSIAAFCICGAALSAAYFELFYALVAMVICMELRTLSEKQLTGRLAETARKKHYRQVR